MNAKITFLGTGGDAIVVGKQYLGSGGIILQFGETQFHLDPGPGSLPLAKNLGLNLRENTSILVSHNHINHANDVNASIAAMTHNGLDKRGVLLCSKSVLSGTEEMVSFLNPHHRNMVERAIAVVPGQRIGINDIEINITKANHSDQTAVGFTFTRGKIKAGFPCDTSISYDILEDYKRCDLLVLNVQLPGNKSKTGLMNTKDALEFIRKTKPGMCIITHFGIKMLDADPREEARYLTKETGVQTIAAKDGLVHEIDELTQKEK